MKLILPLHSYSHSAHQVASRRLVNCYPEAVPQPGKAPITLIRSPGIEPWVELPTSPIRGMKKHRQELYVVAGQKLYLVDRDGNITTIGTITGSGKTPMATNGQQLVTVATPDGFMYEDTTLSKITDPDFTVRGASDVDSLDGFMLFTEPNSGNFFASDFFDAGVIDPLQVDIAGGAPDNLIALLVDHRQILLFGEDSVEIWYNSGGAGFPFLREQNGVVEAGCGARDTPVKANNTVCWLDEKRIARMLSDLTPRRISTTPLEQQWADYTRVSDAYSLSWIHEGHSFWTLTFPSAGASWEYDFQTEEWHDRSSRLANGSMGAWRVAAHEWCYDANIVGDSRSGKLGKLRADVYTEWGELQRMEWTYPNVYGEGRRAFHKRLEVFAQRGQGLVLGQGSDPKIMLSLSDNGGVSFESVQNRSLGAIGEYRRRAVWNRLGTSDDRVYRCAISDPIKSVVIDTQLEVEGGRL